MFDDEKSWFLPEQKFIKTTIFNDCIVLLVAWQDLLLVELTLQEKNDGGHR